MPPRGYEEHRRWGSISRNNDSGKLWILTSQITYLARRRTWHRIYQDNLVFLDNMIRGVARHATRYFRQGDNECVFGYGERQLDSVLVPAFWDIVGQQGSVLTQCPTERHRMRDPLRRAGETTPRKGWVDYRVKQRDTVYVLEIKSAPGNKELRNDDLCAKWNEAQAQLSEVGAKQVVKLGGQSSTLFKTAILFLPIFHNGSRRDLVEDKERSDIRSELRLEGLLRLKPKPDWIACWQLPHTLREPWQDDQAEYWWCSPAVLVLAKLCEKWEKKESGSWVRDGRS